MGIGGALMWPAILGMTYAILPDDKAGLAGGLVLGVAGFGNAVGPMFGGFLTDVFSWRWVFLVNVPITAFAMVVTQREVPESRGDDVEHRIDYLGVATLSVGVVALLLALDQGTDEGFASPAILALFAVAVRAAGRLRRRRGRASAERALVPRDVLRNRTFAGACLAVLLMSAIFFSALLYLPQFMTSALGYSAVRSGAGLLPMMGVFAVTSFVAGSLYDRLGARLIVGVGRRLPRHRHLHALVHRRRHELRRRSCRGWSCSASASGSSTRRSRPPRSPPSIRPARAWPAASSTCARSPGVPSGSASTRRWWRRRHRWPSASAGPSGSTPCWRWPGSSWRCGSWASEPDAPPEHAALAPAGASVRISGTPSDRSWHG